MAMLLKSMFAKPIDRDIKGVIKVGQGDDSNVKQELEEYVVTRELEKYFREFFESYAKGIHGHTDKIGVWISGFFGSGKSHFLKILSYLLDGKRVIDGKTALAYFKDDGKIKDATVFANMQLAAQTPTDVILFNIDSKGDMSGKQSKDAIVSVFLRVFNEMQGFCGSMPFLADLERRLSAAGRFDEFQRLFLASYGSDWTEARNDFDFIQDDVVKILDQLGFMSVEAARNWCERATEPYAISIEDFAKLVKKYIDKQEKNHHVVFLVDEIGQYIGDDSKLMLNLQTVAEDLGTFGGGKVWIIVTSQQDIDYITKTKGNDFSKIQGRFDTRLSLSSANVDEVIRKRILEKNQTGRQTLELLYDEKATILKNLILFNDGIEKKLYASRAGFADVYPFVPYQFNLLGSVLTSIRTHGASGKHLAEGERSMLALFKESAVKLMNTEQGALVPFSMFYDALEQFLDHSHSGVVNRALDNEYLNPDREAECFDVEVLKALFLIKYVKEIVANAENITSLMAPAIDTDRLELLKKVEESLKRLVRQTLVQKSGDIYVFLTDEEQEVNRDIDNQNVEVSEVTAKVSELIFEELYTDGKYRYPAFSGRYTFGFNRFVDDRPYKSGSNFDLNLKILTPNSDYGSDETRLCFVSGRENSVLVVLPEDMSFFDELRAAMRIEKYLTRGATAALTKHEQIKLAKIAEAKERRQNARLFLQEALKQASIYAVGDKIQSGAKEITSRINEALARLVDTVYHKLNYIDAPMGEANIRQLLMRISSGEVKLELAEGGTSNKLALTDVADYINLNSSHHSKTSLKSLLDRFTKAPYGFNDDDVRWLVAKLFKDSDIALFVNSESVSLLNKGVDDILRYLTKREFVEKLLCERREKASDKQKKVVRDICKSLWNYTPIGDDDDLLMKDFRHKLEVMKIDLEKIEIKQQAQSAYPGRQTVKTGKALIVDIAQITNAAAFFRAVAVRENDFLEFADDFEPLQKFFAGEQVGIFDKALRLMAIYDDSKTFIVDAEIERIVGEVKAILRKAAPYGEIFKLPALLQAYVANYSNLLTAMAAPVQAAIKQARQRVLDELTGKNCHEQLSDSFVKRWQELRTKAESCNNVATLQNIKVEADALKNRMLNEIDAAEQKILAAKKTAYPLGQDDGDSASRTAEKLEKPDDYRVKPTKHISLKNVAAESSWRLESAADVDKYLAALREKLLNALEDDTIVNIEL
jgi:hypothetical protein